MAEISGAPAVARPLTAEEASEKARRDREFRKQHGQATPAPVERGFGQYVEDFTDAARYQSGDLQRQHESEQREEVAKAEQEERFVREEAEAKAARRPRYTLGGDFKPVERGPMYYKDRAAGAYNAGVAGINVEYRKRKEQMDLDLFSPSGNDPETHMQRLDELNKWRDDQMSSAKSRRLKMETHEQSLLGQSQQMVRDKGDLDDLPTKKAAADYAAAAEAGEEIYGLKEKSIADVERHDKMAAEAERQAGDRQMEVYDRIKEADAAVQATHIDPGRSWKNKNAPMKIMSMFAAAINGYITAVQGRENEVLKMMQAEIERDVDAQKADLQTLKSGAGAARSEYAILKDKIGDEAVARDMLIARKLRSTRAQMQQIAAGAKTDEQKRTAAMLIDSVSRTIELRESGIKLGATVMQDQFKNQQLAIAAGHRAAARKKEAQANDPLAALNWTTKGAAKAGQLYLPTLGGFVRNPKDYAVLAEKGSQGRQLIDLADEMIAYSKDEASWHDATTRGLAGFNNNRVLMTLSAMGDNSVLRDGERIELQKIVPTGAELTLVSAAKIGQKIKEYATNGIARTAEGRVDPGMYRRNKETGEQEVVHFSSASDVQKKRYEAAQERTRGR